MMKMRMTMTTEIPDSISCPLVATELVITKGQRKLREVSRPILHTLYFSDRPCDKHVIQYGKQE